jgi:hypothetical protein
MMTHVLPAHVARLSPNTTLQIHRNQTMAKKSKSPSTRQSPKAPADKNFTVSKQAVGGVTGAVLGALVAGPIGAVAGGFAGTVVGEQSARGRKPVKKTVDTIRSEISDMKPMEKLRSVAESARSLVAPRKKSTKKSAAKSASRPAAPKKKKSKASAPKKAAKKKAKAAAKGANTKKRAKKKR